MRWFPLVAMVLVACSGDIEDPQNTVPNLPPRAERPDPLTPPSPEVCAETAPNVGATPLRRLTRRQMSNAIRDLFRLDQVPATIASRLLTIPDGREGGFDSTASAPSVEGTRGYTAIAEELATIALDSRYVDCDVSQESCARSAIEALGRRAFRRPLTAADTDRYLGLYRLFVESDGGAVALSTAFTAMLASPYFVYHAEPVQADRAEDAIVPLDPYALANRMAFFVWNSPPDEALLDAAESGALDTPGGVRAEVARMLADDKLARQTASFYRQWLRLEHVEQLSREDEAFTRSLQDSMTHESERFVYDVMRNGSGTLEELLTASHTIGDEELAALYGSTSVDGRIELNEDERSGLLTHAGVLAELGTVFPEIHRGFWVLESFLCDPPPPPPPIPDEPIVRLETEPCAGCHIRMDPIGFGFAAYDSLGRYHAELHEGGEVNSPDGTLDEEVTGPFENPRELGTRLAASPRVKDCISMQWFRYATGRWESEADGCSVAEAQRVFRESGGDLEALIVAITTTTAFRHRATAELSE